jgi:hypothetical protein
MTDVPSDRLYGLLPAVYRIRDIAQSEPLRALLGLIEAQYDAIDQNISELYDNWFIETCDEWVVPYIGDLLGVRPINDAGGAFSARAYVAHTLGYRQRKGTAAMLEGLARDVTGWPARVVEYFELLDTCQYLNHLRPQNVITPDLRDTNALELLGGPFETIAHTIDVRSIARGRGRYNISNVGLFLWRLQAYFVGPFAKDSATAAVTPSSLQSDARAVSDPPDGRYLFDPTGVSAPLFNRPQTNPDTTRLADEINVPGLLRRLPLYEELEALRWTEAENEARRESAPLPAPVYFSANPVFQIIVDGEPVPFDQVAICDIGDAWPRPLSPKEYDVVTPGPPLKKVPIEKDIKLSVDPVRGRIAFPSDAPHHSSVEVCYTYGFSGNIGAGIYDRAAWLLDAQSNPNPLDKTSRWQVAVGKALTPQANVFTTLDDAIKAWNAQTAPTDGVIVICDNRTYRETLTPIQIPATSRLLIVAADWLALRLKPPMTVPLDLTFSTLRPHVLGAIVIESLAPVGGTNAGQCFIDGLLIEGGVTIASGALAAFGLSQATIAPGNALTVAAGAEAAVMLYRAICGPISLSAASSLTTTDSIVASLAAASATAAAITAPGASLTINTTTVFGMVAAQALSASNAIFTGVVTIERQQTGCVRFSYLPPGSKTAPRYRCQPDLALTGVAPPAAQNAIETRLIPQFTSIAFGQPAYAQLAASCAAEIATGADNEAEMGAFNFLYQPQRLANLATALDEYLRFGLEAGSFNVT